MDQQIVELSPAPYEGRFGRFERKLGEGAAKTVFVAVDLNHGRLVAWAEVGTAHLTPAQRRQVEGEVELMRTLQHPNIIDFLGSWATRDKVVFITEVVESGDLQRFYRAHPRLRLRVIKKWCRQILSALNYLHSHSPPIVHRDVKCENILYNAADGTVKVGDLGLSASDLLDGGGGAGGAGAGFLAGGGGGGSGSAAQAASSPGAGGGGGGSSSSSAVVLGTPHYMAPEVYDGICSPGVDIYAFGMCVLEMVTGRVPYDECHNAAQIFKRVVTGVLPASFSRICHTSVAAFIARCVSAPEAPDGNRPSAADLLADPFLDESVHVPEDDEDVLVLPSGGGGGGAGGGVGGKGSPVSASAAAAAAAAVPSSPIEDLDLDGSFPTTPRRPGTTDGSESSSAYDGLHGGGWEEPALPRGVRERMGAGDGDDGRSDDGRSDGSEGGAFRFGDTDSDRGPLHRRRDRFLSTDTGTGSAVLPGDDMGAPDSVGGGAGLLGSAVSGDFGRSSSGAVSPFPLDGDVGAGRASRAESGGVLTRPSSVAGDGFGDRESAATGIVDPRVDEDDGASDAGSGAGHLLDHASSALSAGRRSSAGSAGGLRHDSFASSADLGGYAGLAAVTVPGGASSDAGGYSPAYAGLVEPVGSYFGSSLRAHELAGGMGTPSSTLFSPLGGGGGGGGGIGGGGIGGSLSGTLGAAPGSGGRLLDDTGDFGRGSGASHGSATRRPADDDGNAGDGGGVVTGRRLLDTPAGSGGGGSGGDGSALHSRVHSVGSNLADQGSAGGDGSETPRSGGGDPGSGAAGLGSASHSLAGGSRRASMEMLVGGAGPGSLSSGAGGSAAASSRRFSGRFSTDGADLDGHLLEDGASFEEANETDAGLLRARIDSSLPHTRDASPSALDDEDDGGTRGAGGGASPTPGGGTQGGTEGMVGGGSDAGRDASVDAETRRAGTSDGGIGEDSASSVSGTPLFSPPFGGGGSRGGSSSGGGGGFDLRFPPLGGGNEEGAATDNAILTSPTSSAAGDVQSVETPRGATAGGVVLLSSATPGDGGPTSAASRPQSLTSPAFLASASSPALSANTPLLAYQQGGGSFMPTTPGLLTSLTDGGGSTVGFGGGASSSSAPSVGGVVQLELVLEQDSVSETGQTVVNRASIRFDFDRGRAGSAGTARELCSYLASIQSLRLAQEQVQALLVPFLAALLETQRFEFRVGISAAVAGLRVQLNPL
jgi:serine/threonine protein kinase